MKSNNTQKARRNGASFPLLPTAIFDDFVHFVFIFYKIIIANQCDI